MKKINGEPMCRASLERCSQWLPLTPECELWAGWLQSHEARAYIAICTLFPTLACTLPLQGWALLPTVIW